MQGLNESGPQRPDGAPPVWLIVGPTASGKSGLAADLAARTGRIVLNADAMQVYADLDVVTARPGPETLCRAPHRLFGFVDAATRYSAGDWARDAGAEIAAARKAGRGVVVVGGAGLYVRALTVGLAPAPRAPAAALAAAEAIKREGGLAALYVEAVRLDPEGAAKVGPTDPQRLLRLVSVAIGLGAPLSRLQADTRPLLPEGDWAGLVLAPDRATTIAAIAARAETILDHGRGEVEALLARGLDPDLPAMKALGVATIGDWLSGGTDRAIARDRLIVETRRYAKRQRTWFRNQTPTWPRLEVADREAASALLGGRTNARRGD